MKPLVDYTKEELEVLVSQLKDEYASFQAKGLALNMARGKPGADQLELSLPLLDTIDSTSDLFATDGTDCRNYGVLDGLPEAKALMAHLLDDAPENVFVFGNGSLPIMYDTIARCVQFGVCGATPWKDLDSVKWICTVPGYDRHFAITQEFGFEMIPVRMDENGPDMDEVEKLVASDASVKGMWCVPKYSNPGGVTYSDEVVSRLAAMPCAAKDFRIFWDNAYAVHHLYDDACEQDQLLDIASACEKAGNPNRYFKFASTSKVTIPGAGLAAMATSPSNIADIKSHITFQLIGHDKINQLRHVRFLQDADGIAAHMSKHAAILKPKFDLVEEKLSRGLDGIEVGTWSHPRGGYFVLFNAPEGCAKRIVSLAKEAGVVMTSAGATWPLKQDPYDSDIRIAPTMPSLDELSIALDVFVCCVKLAAAEKLLGK